MTERKDSKAFSMYRAVLVNRVDAQDVYNIYMGDHLIAEVRGKDPVTQQVIPMRELNDYEESKLHEYAGHLQEITKEE
ncbi:hypothetical protein ACFDTO_34300 [Microbacteriaceae bacterium 4G12]